LAFAARRLFADRVCVVFGTRRPPEDLRGFPEVVVEGLAPEDARALLASAMPAPLDERVRDRIIAETHGNPLALLEWPRGLSAAELAGGFGLPELLPLASRHEESFRRRVSELPPATQRFLALAAAEPTGDAGLVWRAAGKLGLVGPDAVPAIEAGLVEMGTMVSFRHPIVRSVAYGAAAPGVRQDVHRALADATDPRSDPDRRAWHLALATAGPDEEVAAQLELSASVAQARGGVSAAAAMLERSAALTLDTARRAQRTIAAASAHIDAGAPEAGARLLAAAEAGHLDPLSQARVEVLRASSAWGWGDNDEAAKLYLSAARRLHRLDVGLARYLHLAAIGAASEGRNLAGEPSLEEAAKAARTAPMASDPERPQDLLVDGLAAFLAEGPQVAAPLLRTALNAFQRGRLEPGEAVRWSGFQCAAATALWDLDSLQASARSYVEAARELGALRWLPQALNTLALAKVYAGDLLGAATLLGEAASLVEATANNFTLNGAAQLAGASGREDAAYVIATTVDHADARGRGVSMNLAQFAKATLCNGMGHYDDAFAAAQEADRVPFHWGSALLLHELVEAAARSGHHGVAAEAVARLSASAQASGSDWALGIEARSRALLSAGEAAESLYLDAIERLDRSPARPEAARAHLLYGEWLRREKRRRDARQQLRTAYERFSAIGMEAFAERARRELEATGETARKRTVGIAFDLTPQEAQIARLAAEGRTNAEIGAQLFISAHTVEYHLRKVFTKMDVTSRRHLGDALARRSPSVEAGI
jgi:DNA-binding CsgD family transcriptional regulator